jgi:hypothetical protein
MKNLLLFIASVFLVVSCSQDDIDKTLKPHEDKDHHYILWQYAHGMGTSDIDVVPAMDENGHVFVGIEGAGRSYNAKVIALNTDGTELWSKEYTATNYTEISKVMCKNNKVYFSIYQVETDFTSTETIFCLNATDGNQIWSFSPTEEYYSTYQKIKGMAINDNKLVIVANWRIVEGNGNDHPWRYIHYLNPSTGEVTAQFDLEIYNFTSIALSSNNLYICHIDQDNNQVEQTVISKIDMTTNNLLWQYYTNLAIGTRTSQRNISIDSNDNILLLTQTGTPSIFNLTSLNNGGAVNYSVELGNGNHKTTDLLVYPDNSIYDEHRGKKYSSSGSLLWEIEDGSGLLRYESGAMIGANGYAYHNDSDDLTVVKSNGDIAWMYYREANFSGASTPILTNNGNVVVVGKDYITCIKGDGVGIANSAWARPFGNNGNTSSK